jgi:hypothetical protein
VSDRLLIADGPDGLLYAGVCPTVRYTAPQVSDRKLSAALRPFKSEDVAREALAAAGGENVREHVR